MSDNEDTPNDDTQLSTFNSDEKHTARVKWFNNRSGYGFATVTGGERDGEDIFVHHSGISVNNEQYKYLVQGEYVQFNLRLSDNDRHPYQADNIRGVNDGPLMCETHFETKKHRESREGTTPPEDVRRNARNQIRARGGGPREGEQWFLVKRGNRGNNRTVEVE